MPLSRVRSDLAITNDELRVPAEGDLRAYVVFTQLKKDGPYYYAGWLDAADDSMAMMLAKEHYGRDQYCTGIWAAPRQFVGGLHENMRAADEAVPSQREYQIFTQQNAGDQHVSTIRIAATSASRAVAAARSQLPDAANLHDIWAIPVQELLSTQPGELLWRNTDQSYRMARGYSKDVRDKWEKIRADRDIREYEKDDLQETF
jgi:1,2-phenylacetyl-CoA epoxidase PaaB subunit